MSWVGGRVVGCTPYSAASCATCALKAAVYRILILLSLISQSAIPLSKFPGLL